MTSSTALTLGMDDPRWEVCMSDLSGASRLLHTPVLFRRIAVRENVAESWAWFNEPIPSYLLDELGPHKFLAMHEDKLIEAAFYHRQVVQVNVRVEREYPQIDWDACLASVNAYHE